MPKVILEFSLPEENHDFEVASRAQTILSVLDDLRKEIRNKLKYEELSEQEHVAWQKINDVFYELINEYDLGSYV